MNDEYSDAFKAIVPEAPSSKSWADGARRKRRNRTRALAGVAGAAVLALVVPFALTMGSNATLIATPGKSESPSTVTTGPSPDPATDAPGAAACWEAAGQPRRATAEGATDGAVRAWLCGDAGDPESFPGAVGPLEPLLDDVGEIVSLIKAQPTLDDSGVTACTEEYTLAYRIVLDYGDDIRHVVPGALHGCRIIDDGAIKRTGGQELYDAALNLWQQQRDRVKAPSDIVALKRCPSPSRAVVPTIQPPLRPMLPLVPSAATAGFACVEKGEGDDWSRRSPTLDPALVSRIANSMTPDSVEALGQQHLPTWVTISGDWGEAITLQRTSDDTFQWFDLATPMLWKPPADVLVQLDAALEGSEGSPASSATPGVVLSLDDVDQCKQYSALPQASSAEVADLIRGQYCHSAADGGWASTIEEMDMNTFRDHLVAESVLGFQTDVSDPFGHLWLNDGADGHLSIIEDAEGRLWWRSIDGQLMEWRPGKAAQGDLEWIINYPRLMNSDFYEDLKVCGRGIGGSELTLEPSDAESAFVCDPTATTPAEAEREVSAALLAQIMDQVEATATTPGDYERPTGWFVILTNAGGEQFRLVQWSGGTMTGQRADGITIAWTPTGEVREGLQELGMKHFQT